MGFCFIRKIDGLGRLVIPIDLRKRLGITEKDFLDISLVDKQIIIQKNTKSNSDVDFLRKTDELGRLVLPMDFRKALSLPSETEIEIIYDKDKLILQKSANYCIFCKEKNNLLTYKNKLICSDCVKEIVKFKF